MPINTSFHPHISLIGEVSDASPPIEVRYFESGVVRAIFYVRTKDDQHFRIEVYGSQAEAAGDCIRPGNLVAIYGDLKSEHGAPFPIVKADSFATISV